MTATNRQNPTAIAENRSSTSSNELSSQIAIARQRVQDAEKWSSRANRLTIALLVLYVITTALVAGTTPLTIWANGRLRTAETILNELLRQEAKTEQVRIEREARERLNQAKLESDEKIAGLTAEAGRANEAAANANERAGELEKSVVVARLKQEKQRQQNLQLEAALEQERADRQELELAIAPRNVKSLKYQEIIENLKPFAGTEVQLVVVRDFEATRLAVDIAALLGHAGWKIVSVVKLDEYIPGMRDLVDLLINALSTNDVMRPAADALRDQLRQNNIDAQRAPSRDKLPPNTMKIVVGLKPTWYFDLRKWREERDFQLDRMRRGLPPWIRQPQREE
jgi:hypothetical protein